MRLKTKFLRFSLSISLSTFVHLLCWSWASIIMMLILPLLFAFGLIILTAAILPAAVSGVKAVLMFLGWRRALTLCDLLVAGFAPGGKVVFGLELMTSLL